ncbi:hypothetical protein BFP97_14090 [Roseivirga sp. 4D4]|uniref:hypothetical protein n=1 Tax=Roseivirga sp. 4D4 TaxID=1889784 RepID=UPI0008536EB3|nr:hypothetical protein [Roseivirga sp. 4D4]OEK02583.1 hypothetical protein BFP97_14090 [Roseivirga sp. 4D4]
MQSIGKQITISIIVSLVLAGIVFGLQQMESTAQFVHEKVWSIVIFSAILGLIVVIIGDWGIRNMDAQSRPNLFLGLTVLRLLLSMGFVGIVLFVGIEDRIIWVANFFAAYLFYLVFEIYSILSNLRAISTEGEKT